MNEFPSIEALALALGLGAIALMFAFTLIAGAPPVPTLAVVRRAMLRLLPRRLPAPAEGRAAVIYDLGSGWGGLAAALARAYPDHQVIGIERSPLPWAFSRLRLALRPRANLTFRRGDFMTDPLADAGLVVCYLAGGLMPPLARKLAAELAPGALVLSQTFAMPDWRAADSVHADDFDKTPVYLYEIGDVAAASQALSSFESRDESVADTRA
jgi:trans-aconitate methyltransferase